MDYVVVSLERTPERLAAFRGANDAVKVFDHFKAVDGGAVKAVNRHFFDGTAKYSPGALGSALSQITLWRRAVSSNTPLTICEDDAILRKDFVAIHERLLSEAPTDWDLIKWGWNFDSILHIDMNGGLGPAVMRFSEPLMRQGAKSFPSSEAVPALYSLKNAFGTLCYSISPKGAERLLRDILPLREEEVIVPGLDRTLPNYCVDVAMNKRLKNLSAFVSFPPLAISPNDKTKSTITPADH